MGKYKNKTYPLRIDNTLMEKVKIISEKEDRTTNKQIERIIREYIEEYESRNGEIKIEEQDRPDVTSGSDSFEQTSFAVQDYDNL